MDMSHTLPEGIERVLLLVDDEESILSSLRRMLRRDGYRILTASSGASALDILAHEPVGVILSDQRMPGMTGTEFLSVVKERYPDTVRMVLSGYTELNSIADAINHGAIYKFLTKPWDDELLRGHVAEAFQRFEMKAENQRLAGLNGALVDAVKDILLMVDPVSLRIVFANRGAADLLGYAADELPGLAIGDVETYPQDVFYWEEVATTGFRPLINVETEYRKADGECLPVSKSTAQATFAGGNQVVVMARDLSSQRRVERQLAQANARLAAIFEATSEGMLVIGRDGRLAGMNRRLGSLWPAQVAAGSDDGAAFLNALAADCQPAASTAAAFARALAAPGVRHAGWLATTKGQRLFWASNPQQICGEVVGQVFSFLDASQLPADPSLHPPGGPEAAG